MLKQPPNSTLNNAATGAVLTLDSRIVASAEKAWAFIHECKLLPTPENYAVMFSFCEANDKRLVEEVNVALERYRLDSGRLANALQIIYERWVSPNAQESAIQKTALEFDAELKQIMQVVAGAQAGAENYGQSLSEFGKGIEAGSIEQIKQLVVKMASETKAMAEQNQQLQEQLSSSVNQVNELRQNLDNVKQENLRDALTGIGNRKAFTADLIRATNDSRERGEDLSIVMVDIDFFKKFNDKYGHLVGDQVLKLVAHTLKENIKGRDTVARWGGEEFAILLPQTKVENAVKLADHLRNIVATKKIIRKPQNEDLGVITLSMGTTQYAHGEDPSAFVERADAALYRAKQEGRNRVQAADAPAVGHINTTVAGTNTGNTVTITTEA